ncbi:MAG: response regulator [Patescibacteria group bacterium]
MANVLIVEDDRFLSDIYKMAFTQKKHAVHVCGNGKEALSYLKENKPDIILSDLMMPDMNGFDFLESYVGEKGKLDIPVIVLSNLGQESDKEQCKKFGIKEYLVKTEVDIDTILEKAEKYLK